jgi:hypothetical protein
MLTGPPLTTSLLTSPVISSGATTADVPVKQSPVKPSSVSVSPKSREEIIQLGEAALAELQQQWRSAAEGREKKTPPNYLDYLNNIQSITRAPYGIPLEQLNGDVQRWLEQARKAWLG